MCSSERARYQRNCAALVAGMAALDFTPLLPTEHQAPIIVSFRGAFPELYEHMRARGFVIYPGKLTVADSFRIGCIGRLGEAQMRGALEAVRAVMNELGVKSGAPAKLAASA